MDNRVALDATAAMLDTERLLICIAWFDPKGIVKAARKAGLLLEHFAERGCAGVREYLSEAVAEAADTDITIEACWGWLDRSRIAPPERPDEFLDAVLMARQECDGVASAKLPELCRKVVENAKRRQRAQAFQRESMRVLDCAGVPDDGKALRSWEPFPIDCLPEPLRSFVDVGATALGCDPSMIALPVLAVCAGAIGTTRRAQLKKAWREFPIVWCAVIGRSGSLKSPAHELALGPLNKFQGERFREYDAAVSEYEGAIEKYEAERSDWRRKKKDRGEPPVKPKEPACSRYVVSDCTVESLTPILAQNPRGLLLSRDELSGWLRGFNQYRSGKGADVPNWLEMHRGGTVTVDRKTGVRTIHIPRAAVSVCGTIQPGTIQATLTAEFFECGLAARLLVVAPPERLKSWTDADFPACESERFGALIDDLLSLTHSANDRSELEPVDVQLSVEAKQLWVAFYDEHAAAQFEADDRLGSALAKIEAYAVRFALIFHLVRCGTDDGSSDAVDADWNSSSPMVCP